nr:PEP-CTERM sorting domain-containing protein [Polymorphobacter sp.]
MSRFATAAVFALAGFATSAAQAVTTVTIEAAGVTNTTVALKTSHVETFDGPVSSLPGTYSSLNIADGSIYGGAGGSDFLAITHGVVTITVTGRANYFGLWASAIDPNNTIEFYRGGTLIDHINPLALGLKGPYRGNPTLAFLGQDRNQAFAFINYHVFGGYDEVKLIQGVHGTFESDNNTIGLIPEPTSWLLFIAGFGLVGLRLRRVPTLVVYA